MTKEIKAGDLVMVVKPRICCGNGISIGKIFTAGIVTDSSIRCNCGHVSFDIHKHVADGSGKYCEISRLIKIDPPALPETITHDEEIVA
jgi:hypothetical protein